MTICFFKLLYIKNGSIMNYIVFVLNKIIGDIINKNIYNIGKINFVAVSKPLENEKC